MQHIFSFWSHSYSTNFHFTGAHYCWVVRNSKAQSILDMTSAAWFEPQTPWSWVHCLNHSATPCRSSTYLPHRCFSGCSVPWGPLYPVCWGGFPIGELLNTNTHPLALNSEAILSHRTAVYMQTNIRIYYSAVLLIWTDNKSIRLIVYLFQYPNILAITKQSYEVF